ncbi:hypothetical protein [Rhodohalobacter barkolensis]|uniref:hypothetical protein n=1 Tax=Rhodohalobacter barkolensis TaxID=2053187 RepID=UPI0013FDA23A|nr:hypothetical protein [Rhodohalobacter barkolensis]
MTISSFFSLMLSGEESPGVDLMGWRSFTTFPEKESGRNRMTFRPCLRPAACDLPLEA